MRYEIRKEEKYSFLRLRSYALRLSRQGENGFTFPELIIVMGITMLLLGFVTINLVQLQRSAAITTSVDTVITDIKNQQIKAMTGDSEGRGTADKYGVHFTGSSYILFHGSTYNASDTTNFVVNLDTSLAFTNDTFPSGNIIFLQTSGEVSSYSATTNSIMLQTTTGSQSKTITINKYGVVTGVQ